MKPVEVVFCGNSVYLCGLAAGLETVKQLRTRLVDMELYQAMIDLKMYHPDVVVAEAISYKPGVVSTLLHYNPRLLLIKIHPTTDSLEVIAGEQHKARVVEELVQVILEQANRP